MSELFEICRDKKETINPRRTNQDLAEAIGKSTNTVAQFLRGEAPNATFDTVAGLCRELGISIDEYAGINTGMTEETAKLLNEKTETLSNKLRNKEAENAELKTSIEKMSAHMATYKKSLRMHRIVTLVLLALLSIAFIALLFDILIPTMGWVRNV